MRLRLAAPVIVLALAGLTLPAVATAPGATTGSPTTWAAKALQSQAERLGVDAKAFRFESVRTSLIGTHVRGRQYRDGVAINGTAALISAVDSQIAQVEAKGSSLPGSASRAPVGAAAAQAAALARLQVSKVLVPSAVTRAMVPSGGRLVDTYEVSVVAPKIAAVVVVDAATGRVRSLVDEAQHVDGTAKVFDPNPIQSTRNRALRQPLELGLDADADLDSAQLTAARRTLPLKGLDATALSTGRLQGPWVNVIAGGYNAPGARFDLTRSDPRFEGLMAYAHVDRFQRYLQSLGFRGGRGVNAEAQEVVALPLQGFDNSFYQPGNDVIVMGAGGVDDGEDAEVLLHEYGHAVQDAQVPGWGQTDEGGAMGEGFGDFQAAAYFARTSRGFGDLCVAEWDATSYATGAETCLRRMDSRKRYPRDIADQVHDDGELWSAYLWRVRSHLPGSAAAKSDAALRLVLTSHELLTPSADFRAGVAALRTAARALRHPEYVTIINAEARRTGFRV